jgi:hypothetical protein
LSLRDDLNVYGGTCISTWWHDVRMKAAKLKATKPRIYGVSFASVYPLYIKKAEAKGRTKAEVDKIICWLTGHTTASLKAALAANLDFETFYRKAPGFQPKAKLITGVVCGVRIEDIEDKTMRRLRYLDKLIDELAKGKPMDKILRN